MKRVSCGCGKHMSKTDHWRRLMATEGWWHDPIYGVRPGKTFREWSKRLWKAEKGFRGPARRVPMTVKEANRLARLRRPRSHADDPR